MIDVVSLLLEAIKYKQEKKQNIRIIPFRLLKNIAYDNGRKSLVYSHHEKSFLKTIKDYLDFKGFAIYDEEKETFALNIDNYDFFDKILERKEIVVVFVPESVVLKDNDVEAGRTGYFVCSKCNEKIERRYGSKDYYEGENFVCKRCINDMILENFLEAIRRKG